MTLIASSSYTDSSSLRCRSCRISLPLAQCVLAIRCRAPLSTAAGCLLFSSCSSCYY